MRRKYILIIALFILFTSGILITQKKETFKPGLKMRAGLISGGSEWINTKKAIEGLENDLHENPGKSETKIKLAQAYIQEARITGDHNYYEALAYELVNELLKSDENNFQALCCKATLEASAHQFNDALNTANRAIQINPHSAYIFGIVCDAQVELGNYKEAITAGDKMVSLRPDIRSYARISYLREIIGDYPGAITAMKMALESGIPGLEQTEWTRTYLGHLYEITGKKEIATEYYNQSLYHRPNFAPALAGLGRLSKINRDYPAAINYYLKAAEVMQDYSFFQELGVLYALSGEKEKSTTAFHTSLEMLQKHQHPTSIESGIGHQVDRELALVHLAMNEYEDALNNAKAEYLRRPGNMDVNEVLAWCYYQTGDDHQAKKHILKALATHSKNAQLWYKAGLIFKANKNENLGNEYCRLARYVNPNLDTTGFNARKINNNLALN